MQKHSIIRVGLVRVYAMPNGQESGGTEQRTIFGDTIDEQVRVETSGRIIRPFKRMVDQIAAEYRINFTEDGLEVSCVNPANTFGIETTLFGSAFETFDVKDETTVGVKGSSFGSILQHARYGKSSDDPISISVDSRRMESTVNRPIGGHEATISERAELIDPDSIRQSPDIPELDMDVEVDIDPETFIRAVGMLSDSSGDTIRLGSTENSLILNQNQDMQKRNIEIDADLSAVSEWAMFSAPLMHNLVTALNNGYVDSLSLRWEEEFPIMADFEREGVMEGTVMIAPRVQPGEDEI